MPKVVVLRCPECGSLDVWCDESRSFIDISCFCCRTCGNEEYCDSWQRDYDWRVEIEVDDETKLPAAVAPLAPGDRLLPFKD